MISFWEREHFLQYDFIIIGGGIVGLSVAASLAEAKPTAQIVVLERGLLPTGASTKNAGFACIGSPTELLADLKQMPENEVLELVERRYKGLEKLKQRLTPQAIDYEQQGSYEIITDQEAYALEQISYLNQVMQKVLPANFPAFEIANPRLIQTFGFHKEFAKHLIINNFEGQLNTGKMMKSLTQYVLQKGVQVLTGAEVVGFDHTHPEHISVAVQHTHLQQTLYFKAPKLAICTNAFAPQLLPQLNVVPARGQVLITKPIENLTIKGIFHFNEGYYYFRNAPQNRLLFGGGRNLDFETEASNKFEYNQLILNDLNQKLHQYILPNTPFEIDMQWTGIMGFGSTKTPFLKQINERIVAGVKLSGMGVAIGSLLGQEVAQKLLL